jgi:hypothetical protein
MAPKPLILAYLVVHKQHAWEGKQERVDIFQLEVADAPQVEVDHREVVRAGFFTAEQALALELFPPLREVILARHQAAE